MSSIASEDSEPGEGRNTDASEKRSDENSESGDVATERRESEETATDVENFEDEYDSSDDLTPEASDILKACMEGSLDEVKELVEEDKSVLKCRDKNKRTPLHYACRLKRVDIVKYLLQKGAKVNAHDYLYSTPLHAAVEVSESDRPGMKTHDSLEQRENRAREIVRILLDAGADECAHEEGGGTPLLVFVGDYLYCSRGSGNIPLDIINMLLEEGDEPKEEMAKEVLRYAAEFGDLRLLELCLQYGGDINELDNSGLSLLHNVFGLELPAVFNVGPKPLPEELKCRSLKYLLDKGCTRVNYTTKSSISSGTPLSDATSRGLMRCVKVLLSYGAQMDVEQPLHHMVWPFVTELGTKDGDRQRYRQFIREVIQLGSVFDLETKSGLSSFKSLLDPEWKSYSELRRSEVEGSCDFLKIILKENAMKLPSQRGHVLTMKEPYFYRGNQFDILKCPNLWVIPHLYKIGYKVEEIEEILEDPDAQEDLTEQQQRVLDQVKEMDVLRLQELCRLKIRRLLGSPLSAKLQKLPLPKPMQDYLHDLI